MTPDGDTTPIEGYDKLTGAAQYAMDLGLPGMLHAKLLRSPHAHARIRRIDTTRAAALPGVVCVATGADTKRLPDPCYGVGIRDQPLLAHDKVRHVGDIVAAVVAVDEATAFAALPLIAVEYDLLPPVMTIEAALAPDAPLLFETPSGGQVLGVGAGAVSLKEPRPNVLYEFGYRRGDVDALLARCDHVFTDRFEFSRINHFHLEPFVNIARATGRSIELWSCNQDPFILRNDVARIFGVPTHRVRIHTPLIGGGFGGKSYCKMEPLVVLLAQMAKAPVRLCFTMDEGLLTLTKHAAVLSLTTGVMRDGTLVARRSEIQLDGGAYSDASVSTTIKTGYRITGVYRWQGVDTRAYAVRTTTVPGGSFRGFGGTQASFASESQLDMIARRLGIDPYDMRQRNLLAVGEPYAPGDSGVDSDLGAGLAEAARRLGYHAPRAPGRGKGLSIGFKDGGGTGNHGQAIVKVTQAGEVFVHTAAVEMGQGAMTALGLIAARVLGLPLSSVTTGTVDTDHSPLDTGTHVSAASTVTGTAVARAAADVKAQVLAFAAERLGCAADDLVLDGWAVRRGNARHALAPLIGAYYGGVGFEFVGRGVMKIPYDTTAPLGSENLFWIPSWAGAEVEIDEETGVVRVLQLVVGGDSGTSLSASACRGQIEGAALQAYGQALFEELQYDGAAPANATPRLYRVPTVADLPARFTSFVLEQGHGPGPFGLKGIGEAGMLAVASAIGNAIEDAAGIRLTRIPFTPERVLQALAARPPR